MQQLMIELLRQMKGLGATELFLSKGKAPAYRINGHITNTQSDALSHTKISLMAHEILSQEQLEQLNHQFELSVSHHQPGIGRYRMNLFKERGEIAMVVRELPEKIPTPEALNFPAAMKKVALLKRGLVLLVGPSGMGKSTSMASLLDYRNEKTASHIITIEDPIEYVIHHKQSVVNQREIDVDAKNYSSALKVALKQSPDVIALSDIPDQETLQYALSIADSGKLCVATMNASNVRLGLDRLIALYPKNQREQILQQLGNHIKAMLAQQIVPSKEGQRVPAYELLLISNHVTDIITRDDLDALNDIMEREDLNGMQTLDQSLYNLFQQDKITAETALEYAQSYRNMRLKMRISTASRSIVSQ